MNNNNNTNGFIFILLSILFLFLLFGIFGVFSFRRNSISNERFSTMTPQDYNLQYFRTNNIGKEVATNPAHVHQRTLHDSLLEQQDVCAMFEKKKSL